MTLSDLSIQRPILTWMMMLALIVFGVLGFQRLGVDQFPNMDFPVLTVIADARRRDPRGHGGGRHRRPRGAAQHDRGRALDRARRRSRGSRRSRVEFELGTDLDVAAQEVRDKIARARRELPEELEPPTVDTFDLQRPADPVDPVPDRSPAVDTSEYVRRHVKPVFETIPGVAGVTLFGRRDRTSASGSTATRCARAVWRPATCCARCSASTSRCRAASSRAGASSTREDRRRVPLRRRAREARGRARRRCAGVPVATWRASRTAPRTCAPRPATTARSTVGVGIRKQSGGNTVAIVDEVFKRRIGDMRAILPERHHDRRGGTASSTSRTRSARPSPRREFSLVFGALLAVFTVFVFLRRTRPTLIVAAAIPISLIATFGLVWLAGYTLNTMTLLGMALAVGVVIDDAIVVLENIERHREAGEDAAPGRGRSARARSRSPPPRRRSR